MFDQISIPSLSRGLSELACTLVQKQWCYVCHIVGSNPAADNVEELQHGSGHKGKLFFSQFFCRASHGCTKPSTWMHQVLDAKALPAQACTGLLEHEDTEYCKQQAAMRAHSCNSNLPHAQSSLVQARL